MKYKLLYEIDNLETFFYVHLSILTKCVHFDRPGTAWIYFVINAIIQPLLIAYYPVAMAWLIARGNM